ncbi:hypothetical protein LCGC14_2262520 [marine sediment metagenome]|uniref:Uncharacterized protein n=1 Tax=marine sediment metagenome TaxID=412755 RepID=A0A0F9CZF8_9ZZZZ
MQRNSYLTGLFNWNMKTFLDFLAVIFLLIVMIMYLPFVALFNLKENER